jgi:hypothetical protein
MCGIVRVELVDNGVDQDRLLEDSQDGIGRYSDPVI